jgi:hypothetical protein
MIHRVLKCILILLTIVIVVLGLWQPFPLAHAQYGGGKGKEGIAGETNAQELAKAAIAAAAEHNTESHNCGGTGCSDCNEHGF